MLLGVIFLAAIVSLITAGLGPGSINDWLSLLRNNWLTVLFKLNAGLEGMQFDRLHGVNALDLLIMALVGMTFLGLGAALRKTSKVWSITAAVLPFLGIVIFIVTELAGRSGVMGAGLIISFLMLRSKLFGKMMAWMGILANVCLLAGDFGTSANAHSTGVAILIGIGYVLLMMWFFLIGRRLFQIE
jgi:hypothetical protein